MRTIEETLNDAKSLVDKIYENMTTVQTCEAIREQIKTMKICYTGGDESKILVLDRVLDQEQMEVASNLITEMIDNRRDEAAKYLDFLNGKVPAILNPVFEDAVKDMKPKEVVIIPEKIKAVEQQEKPKRGFESRMEVEAVKKMLADGKSVQEIADFYEYEKTQTVYTFLKKHNIKKPAEYKREEKKTRVLSEDDIPEIKRLYTNGTCNLKEVADQLGVKTTEMHDFIANHRLARPVKKDDIFLDSKMGKNEFKAKMMSGRK